MKILLTILILLFLALQYELWFSKGGISDVIHLKRATKEQQMKLKTLTDENARLEKNIRNLKESREMIEGKAREELGMIKENETFYQVITKNEPEKQ